VVNEVRYALVPMNFATYWVGRTAVVQGKQLVTTPF
jgi:hypothetical protein